MTRMFHRERAQIERALRKYLPSPPAIPRDLDSTIRYVLFPGGKRLRPILALLSCEALGGRGREILPAACALEYIHNYSLVHDDLPAMDDDDLRRGKPTCHKKFGEAMAILAGDALQALAYEVIAQCTPTESRVPDLVREVARASGACGMVGGQVLDITHRSPADPAQIHRMKTGAMFTAAARVGAVAAGASRNNLRMMDRYGRHIGLVFQIVDDILDVVRSTRELGKTSGKDVKQGKRTYPARYGMERSRAIALTHARRARQTIHPLGPRGRKLVLYVDAVIDKLDLS